VPLLGGDALRQTVGEAGANPAVAVGLGFGVTPGVTAKREVRWQDTQDRSASCVGARE